MNLRRSESILSAARLVRGNGESVRDGQGRELWTIDPSRLCRDAHGWLWADDPEDLSGLPFWKHLHPARHRRCTDELRCQVCGEQVPEPSTWLLDAEVVADGDARVLAFSPPCCQACAALSRVQCPEMGRRRFELVEARRVSPYGAVGELFAPDLVRLPDGRQVGALEDESVTLTPGDPRFRRLVVRQRVMALEKWSRVPVDTRSGPGF